MLPLKGCFLSPKTQTSFKQQQQNVEGDLHKTQEFSLLESEWMEQLMTASVWFLDGCMDGWENRDLWWNQTCNLISGATATSPACKMLPPCCSDRLLTSQLLGWRMLPAEWHLPAWGNGAILCHQINLPYDKQAEDLNVPGAPWFWLAFTWDISTMQAAFIVVEEKRILDKYLFANVSAQGHFGLSLLQFELLRPSFRFLFSPKAQGPATKVWTHKWGYLQDLVAKNHMDLDGYSSKCSRSFQFSYKHFCSR